MSRTTTGRREVRPGRDPERPRVALLAGTLGRAGAEKQLLYMAEALQSADVDIRVFSVAQNGFYGQRLRDLQLGPNWFGRHSAPPLRAAALVRMVWSFRPHVVQSVQAFTNIYAAAAAECVGAISIGGLRSDVNACLAKNPIAGRALLRVPDALAVNSLRAVEEIARRRLARRDCVYLLPNAIDGSWFTAGDDDAPGDGGPCTAVFLGRLNPVKRPDLFLRALAMARRTEPALRGMVVGRGVLTPDMEKLAAELQLPHEAITFLGEREDVAGLLRTARMMVLCSESEGCPNAILEAMAAGLPVISTPAGDVPEMMRDGETGYLIPFDDPEALARAMIRLARSAELSHALGNAGRRRVELLYSLGRLRQRLCSLYADVIRSRARGRSSQAILASLESRS